MYKLKLILMFTLIAATLVAASWLAFSQLEAAEKQKKEELVKTWINKYKTLEDPEAVAWYEKQLINEGRFSKPYIIAELRNTSDQITKSKFDKVLAQIK